MNRKDSNDSAISDESIDHLEAVKKGKPRRFVMICKGTNVVSLVVYKKGSLESQKKAAKESGKGQVYHGIVAGQGLDIRFLLARSDGFDATPVKNSVAKNFLEESGDFKCKPTFEIVDVLPNVPDDDDSPNDSSASTTPTASDDPFEPLYHGLLETLPTDIARLRSSQPDVAEKLLVIVSSAAKFAQASDFKTAYTYLEKASEAIASRLSTSRVQEAEAIIPEGIVEAMKAALAEAQSRWTAALEAARIQLQPVRDALQGDLAKASQGLANVIDSYEQDLLAELVAGQAKADDVGISEAVQTTIERIHSLRDEALQDEVFIYLESCGVPVIDAFVGALDDVESLLTA